MNKVLIMKTIKIFSYCKVDPFCILPQFSIQTIQCLTLWIRKKCRSDWPIIWKNILCDILIKTTFLYFENKYVFKINQIFYDIYNQTIKSIRCIGIVHRNRIDMIFKKKQSICIYVCIYMYASVLIYDYYST